MKPAQRPDGRSPSAGKPATGARKGHTAGRAKKPESAPPIDHFRWSSLWGLAALLVLTLAAYYPAWHGGMLWDDDGHITPPHLRQVAGLYRIWCEFGASQQYYPVLHSVFWALHRIWGDNTFGYHLATICLHAVSAWLLALILRRLRVAGAALAAVVFALHPVHVESVAWISEMKNTLSGVFYLCAAMAYLEFDFTRRKRYYALAAAAFVLALLSKSVTATLPLALLIVLWWRRGELRLREDIAPLVPLVVVGASAGLLTAWVERTYIGAQGTEFGLSLVERGLVAGRAAWFYAAALIWPADLMFMYPKWQLDPHAVSQLLFPLGLAGAVLALWWARRWSRAPLAAVLFFLVALAPALGFVSVFPFRYSYVADHFQYLASIGIITLVCAGATTAARLWPEVPRLATLAAPLAVAVPLGAATWAYAGNYVDSDTLYRATIRSNPTCWLAHHNLGFDLLKRGKSAEALAEFEEAVRIEPTAVEAQQNLGSVLLDAGRAEEAIPHFAAALKARPDYPTASFAMGKALASLGRMDGAIEYFDHTLSLSADYPEARAHLGAALEASGQLEAALKQYASAVSLEPESVFAHSRYARLLRRLGRLREAVTEYQEVLRRDPTFAGVHNELGVTLADLGRLDEAVAAFRTAIRLFPEVPELHANLGRALLAAGRTVEAEASFREAQRIQNAGRSGGIPRTPQA
jgi:tetratricopeptide (TPR) repeat protein